MIRLSEERMEATRRGKVLQGEWKEEESHQKLHEMIKEDQKHPLNNNVTRQKILRHLEVLIRDIRDLPNPEQVIEQEYHFDEGLG
mmetsp:Transcript_28524/g.27495  ORF Transcript_28524/g.27495 Transcript_28524/m.27495 type:complete len:85 (-) Transcript_28524:262-516(-)